eukprot:CAMPEP_0197592530 /NCGR_PEP_ID=MMETSP1326-20131121/15144_1 /TAXON_ID=1155430 /ORGANISM="Genus nov. species nov., Strain RCC2288" /LENGTH=198 /DNA_ID=CAMNT_0043158235 /DNA_START=332 /DNA_END=925 /DNA_ORIENTATION=-
MEGGALLGELAADFAAALRVGKDDNKDAAGVDMGGGGGGSGEVQDGVCAICLDGILEADVALVKTCLHGFCTVCIIRWTNAQQESAAKRLNSHAASSDPTCPCCKAPFASLLIYRTLDGELTPDIREESVCLLRRARWLPTAVKSAEWDAHFAEASAAALHGGGGGGGFYEDDDSVYDEDYLDDEEEYMARAYGGGSR